MFETHYNIRRWQNDKWQNVSINFHFLNFDNNENDTQPTEADQVNTLNLESFQCILSSQPETIYYLMILGTATRYTLCARSTSATYFNLNFIPFPFWSISKLSWQSWVSRLLRCGITRDNNPLYAWISRYGSTGNHQKQAQTRNVQFWKKIKIKIKIEKLTMPNDEEHRTKLNINSTHENYVYPMFNFYSSWKIYTDVRCCSSKWIVVIKIHSNKLSKCPRKTEKWMTTKQQ